MEQISSPYLIRYRKMFGEWAQLFQTEWSVNAHHPYCLANFPDHFPPLKCPKKRKSEIKNTEA
ncbi:MAG: hypothetical protein COW84_06910 [Gammaproteobacteria bacterium CG22_combo_CG10-13_8_21_14_all_40_8]|nr:MAG: hypothetical protein COW84_06910 [Gammaproteobacteria bacterium CG22_combo_CG10-13_8_21_14_all_40_8]